MFPISPACVGSSCLGFGTASASVPAGKPHYPAPEETGPGGMIATSEDFR